VRPLPVRNAPRTLLAPLKGLLARVRALTTLFRSGSTFTPRRIGQRGAIRPAVGARPATKGAVERLPFPFCDEGSFPFLR
jgi:hypothetical protein